MRIFILLFLLIFTIGCSTRNLKLDQNKIFTYNQGMDLDAIYLDKDNIENVRINSLKQKPKLNQFKQTELFEMKYFIVDSLFPNRKIEKKRNISLIIIDGIVFTDSLKENTRIDLKVIKSMSIVTKEKMNDILICKSHDGDVLLITTK